MSMWLETYGETVKAIADELIDPQDPVSERIQEILSDEPEAQRQRILTMARELRKGRIERALKWRNTLGISEENRLVDDASQAFIEDLANPSLIDLLALKETVPRSEIGGSGLGRQIRSAHEKAERRIMSAAKQLQDLEITEAEIRILVDARISTRLQAGLHGGNNLNPILRTLNALISVLESVAYTYTGEAKSELYSLCENLDNDPAYAFEGRETLILKLREVLALFRGGARN